MEKEYVIQSQVIFPRIRVCSQSMHSKSKMLLKYPFFSQQALQAFYGDFRELFGKTKKEWIDIIRDKKLNDELDRVNAQLSSLEDNKRLLLENLFNLNITDFFDETSPLYIIPSGVCHNDRS